MDTIKINKQNTLMVAHRGVSGIEKENTCAAFVAAGNRSYHGIETDVHRTLDGKFVVFHDDNTGRVCIDDMVVEQSTFDGLRSLLLTDTNDKKDRWDLRIPTLQEYISICKRYEKTAVLELKNDFREADIYAIVDIIKELDYLEHVIFISFSLANLVILRAKYPEQPAQYLVEDYDESLISVLTTNHLDLDILYTSLTAERVKALHEAGIKINVWTCDDKAAAEELADWGIEYLTTDILE